MTTFVDFLPTAAAPFRFQPTLDGAAHSLVVTWGLAGQRWYVNLYDRTGALVFYLPLIASPSYIPIQSITWDATTQLVTVTTTFPHGLKLGTIVSLTISNAIPATYNGVVDVIPNSPNTLIYPQITDPGGNATTVGAIGRDINLGGGYLKTSTLVFRDATQQFEVTP